MWLELGIFIIFLICLAYIVSTISIWLKHIEQVTNAYNEFLELYSRNKYLSKRDLTKWLDKWSYLSSKYEKEINYEYIFRDKGKKLNYILRVIKNPEQITSERNEKYIEKELVAYKELFDSIDNRLTLEQKRAVIIDEANNLIVAGAGTGKTSTLLAKAAYIYKKGLAAPEEILILSFNRDVRNEIEERLKQKTGLNFPVSTFHALGLNIIAKIEGKKLAISELAEDRLKLPRWVEEQINGKVGRQNDQVLDGYQLDSTNEIIIQQDKVYCEKLAKFIAFNYHPYKNEFDFTSLGEYYQYLREHEIRSLQGDLVKSYEENEIANFLYLNGISYEYELDYKHDVSDESHRQYQPDFYLLDYDIYLEHFGINREGKTAPYIDTEKYTQQMKWKRQIHKQYGTTLIETYSYQKSEGTLLGELEKKFKDLKIEFKPIPSEEIFNKIKKQGLINPFARLVSKFLNLYKSGNYEHDNLRKKAESYTNPSRYISFLEVFQPIYDDYEKYLELQQRIDFNDMINKATKYVEDDRYRNNFKYVLVDEFQDISLGRYRFLKSLLRREDVKSFCVGDDWQAIYRFTGGEVSVMTKFKDYFDPSEYLYLNQTFRFDNRLSSLSSKFIMKNRGQLPKEITSSKTSDFPAITIKWVLNYQIASIIEKCLNEIESLENLKNGSIEHKIKVYLIGRYRKGRPKEFREIQAKFPKFDIEYYTAHKSKGTEADYVIVLNLILGKFGFPCLIEDDPILNLVLAEHDYLANAEERRLFYVAITRAKKHVYLISEEKHPSAFVNELISEKYDINIQGNNKKNDTTCPICKTGQIIKIEGDWPTFYACNNYPYCNYKANKCPSCGQGFLINDAPNYVCSYDECGFVAKKCSRCEGYMILRKGTPDFWGCSNYPITECRYTETMVT